ncbi:MAG: PqqD family protein [Theionarchaea archaeon]|nr:PqqD family protein [Theionarchaea archaeon]
MRSTLCKGVRIRQEEFGGVVLIKDSGVFQVDEVGFDILSKIRDGSTVDEIVRSMKEKYEGEHEQIESDVHKFMQNLVKVGIIELEKT